MPNTPIPPLSEGTTAAVDQLVDYAILREYGIVVDEGGYLIEDQVIGATMIAKAGLQFDLIEQFKGMNQGKTDGLDGYVDATLRVLVSDGIEGRRCQCHTINGTCSHGTAARCEGHYESDVPPIDGVLLCGTCHIAEHQTRVEN